MGTRQRLFRRRAERRLGELMADERKAGKVGEGAREKGIGKRGSAGDPRSLSKQVEYCSCR